MVLPERADIDEHTGPVLVPGVVSLVETQRRTLKHGDTYALFDTYGDIQPGEASPAGVFHQDTRFLSDLRFTIEGRIPLMLSSTVQRNNIVLSVDLTNPDVYVGDRLVLQKDSFHILRSKFLWQGGCHELFVVTSYIDRPERLHMSLSFEADFADMFEVRGYRRSQRGTVTATVEDERIVCFAYAGLDGIDRRARLCFDATPARLGTRRAEFELDLAPRERESFGLTLQCLADKAPPADDPRFYTALRAARRAHFNAQSRAATIETSNGLVNEILSRSAADLTMLLTDTPQGPYPYAGVPWFSTAFGRDGIITAIEVLWLDPSIARGVLRYLAAMQATETDPQSDAEPGKILHETRQCELARLGEVPFRRYYGSVDSTPWFVAASVLYWQRTRDQQTIEAIWPNIKAALAWIDRYGDTDDDGFIEYGRKRETGLRNQGWKDADDSVFHANGELAQSPIALCEVQGYVYLAKQQAARIARDLGEPDFAIELEREADALRKHFDESYWCEEIQSYAIALDGDKQRCCVRTSNAGQTLFSGIAWRERAAVIADGLFARDFYSGWGIRTVSAHEGRYNPTSYHNGSIWPHDNAMIALGLARYGFKAQVLQLTEAIFETAAQMELRRLPELFCGFPRRRDKGPTLYPVACTPQAWAACAPYALLQACLGLELDAFESVVRLRRPHLPASIEWMIVRRLQVGNSRLDVLLRRADSGVSVSLLDREGEAEVLVTL